jgi:8-oxo-dGTP pyrophosphatase MutT (NUDIX family)
MAKSRRREGFLGLAHGSFLTLLAGILMLLLWLRTRGSSVELIEVYVLGTEKPQVAGLVTGYRNNGTSSLDEAHRLGLPHRGLWVLLVDQAGMVLQLRRSAQVRTCPNSWGFIDEHPRPKESFSSAAVRALHEELGLSSAWLYRYVTASVNLTSHPIWEQHNHHDVSSAMPKRARCIVCFLTNVYVCRTQGKIDVEIAGLWAVILRIPAARVPLHVDHDAAAHRWLHHTIVEASVHQAPGEYCDEASRLCHLLGARSLRAVLLKRRPGIRATHHRNSTHGH